MITAIIYVLFVLVARTRDLDMVVVLCFYGFIADFLAPMLVLKEIGVEHSVWLVIVPITNSLLALYIMLDKLADDRKIK